MSEQLHPYRINPIPPAIEAAGPGLSVERLAEIRGVMKHGRIALRGVMGKQLWAHIDAQAATIEQLQQRVVAAEAELLEGSGLVEELELRLQHLQKQAYGKWIACTDQLPTRSRTHPRTGCLVSQLMQVAQNGETLPDPHYMRSDNEWFFGSFVTPNITHWQPLPPDPGLPNFAAPPLGVASQGEGPT